jgi:hypothetical protein
VIDGTEFHLCQPDELKSCGACCGLYNYRNNSRKRLQRRLLQRTRLFEHRDGDLERYVREAAAYEGEKLYETIYNCEFLGFINAAATRVGCLLHPACNGGYDLRGTSFYGEGLCRDHVCPSYGTLTSVEKEVVIRVVHDWYLYGLCITDIDLVKAYLFHVQNRLGEEFDTRRLENNGRLEWLMQQFFSWKAEWPFRRDGARRFGKYYFVDDDYYIARVEYGELGMSPSVYDTVLVSLASEFTRGDQVRAAEHLIEKNINAVVKAYVRG